MSEGYTLEGLNKLKKAHERGITKIREKDSWVEYGSLREMAGTIATIEAALREAGVIAKDGVNNPVGTKRVRFF